MAYYEDIKLSKEFIIQRRIGKRYEHEPHFHHLLEIGITQKHTVRYQFGNREIYGKEGDVFLCRPFEAHWSYITDAEKPYHSILVYFTPSVVRPIPMGYKLLAPFYSMKLLSPLIPGESPFAQSIRRSAEQALFETDNRVTAWESREYMHMIDILINIYAYFVEQNGQSGCERVDEDMIRTISYILVHITEEISVDKLVEDTKMGKTAFFHKFRLLTGLSPNHFINRNRLQIAADLLVRTEMSITEVSFESGFSSLSTFNKQFKQFYLMNPAEYRKLSLKREIKPFL